MESFEQPQDELPSEKTLKIILIVACVLIGAVVLIFSTGSKGGGHPTDFDTYVPSHENHRPRKYRFFKRRTTTHTHVTPSHH